MSQPGLQVSCPYCKAQLRGHEALDGGAHKPYDGAYSICAECCELSRFADGKLIKVSPQEWDALPQKERDYFVKVRLGLDHVKKTIPKKDFPPGYYACCATMQKAAEAWVLEHPCAQLSFRELDPKIMYVGALEEKIICWLGCNEPARELLRTIDRATNHEATVMQTRVVLEHLFSRGGPRTEA
jgi:hypothetical protein